MTEPSLPGNAQRDVLPGRDLIGEPNDVGDFRSVEAETLRGNAVGKLQRKNAHSYEIGPMDALKTLGNDGLHTKEFRSLGSPIAAGTGAVFLSGEDDERNSVFFVGHARIVNERRLSMRLWRRFPCQEQSPRVARSRECSHLLRLEPSDS